MAKYNNLRKTDRDVQLIRFYNDHPQMSEAEVGRHFGISHARVSQILKKHGVPVQKYHTPVEIEVRKVT
jgi:DNA-directed RNA polymerase specialized sigma subunit